MKRLVLLSGPSCVGKGPLLAAVKRLYPSLAVKLRKVLLYNDRPPRSGETDGVDYRFTRRQEVVALQERDDFIVLEVRPGNFQALAKEDVQKALREPGIPFLEAFYRFGDELWKRRWLSEKRILSVFVPPLSREEVLFLKERQDVVLEEFVAEVMKRKLLRPTKRQKGILSRPDLDDVELRAGTAYEELKAAWRYDYVIPNHDGEDSENWDRFYYPIGDARRTLLSFVDVLEGKEPRCAEKWSADLLV